MLRSSGGVEQAALPVAGAPANARPPGPAGRDARLDMFRGIALVMIFINHVPGTIYESFTSRNFGFSDAAEAFVFMSGMAAGLAYSSGFRSGSWWLATARVWARARQAPCGSGCPRCWQRTTSRQCCGSRSAA